MDEKEKILVENINEYFVSAMEAFNKQRFNSATTLFFKSMCAGVDLFLLKSEGEVPSSHSNRFRIIQEKYPEIYMIIDKDFPFYQDSYTKKMDSEAAEMMKHDAEKIKKISFQGNI
ncbi:hypothetical protein HQ545_04300 [Candidatus Woesearchaeota archaeon]|nr:hypothetical protein [Candidatus Woesearchaeota archaeon]